MIKIECSRENELGSVFATILKLWYSHYYIWLITQYFWIALQKSYYLCQKFHIPLSSKRHMTGLEMILSLTNTYLSLSVLNPQLNSKRIQDKNSSDHSLIYYLNFINEFIFAGYFKIFRLKFTHYIAVHYNTTLI